MHGRRLYALLASVVALSLIGALVAVPAFAQGGGGSEAEITAEFSQDCTDFKVWSTKDISNIKGEFQDGTPGEIDNINQKHFEFEGDKPIAFIVVKSGTTEKRFDCGPTKPPPPQCSDGIDNDKDGEIDFGGGPKGEPPDTDCDSDEDDDESNGNGAPQCSDDVDNDGDDLVDEDDPGCHTDGDPDNPASYDPDDNDETDEVTEDRCTAEAGDEGLSGDGTIAQQLWDALLEDAGDPLFEDPERNGEISGPLGDAFQPPEPLAPLEDVGDEVSCAVDLLFNGDTGPLPDL